MGSDRQQAGPSPHAAESGRKFGHNNGMTLRKRLLRDRALRVADLPDGQNLFDFSGDCFGHRAFSLPKRVRAKTNFAS
jgi:hypothetical protein